MPLRHRILAEPATVQDLALASEQKYWEGVEMLVAGRRGAGIYLLGYCVEMLLKNACFLADGARPGDPVGPRFGPIRHWARSHLPGMGHESYHSLWFWVNVLRRKRSAFGQQFPRPTEARIVQRVRRVYGIWFVGMRYKPDMASEREAESMLSDVTWLRDRRSELVV